MKREYWKYFSVPLPYLKRYKWLAVLCLILLGVGSGVALLAPWPQALLVDSALGHKRAPGFVTSLFGADRGVLIVVAAIATVGVVLLVQGVSVIQSYVSAKLEQRIAFDFRSDLFEHCTNLSQGYLDSARSGDFMYRINTEAHRVGELSVTLPPLLQSVLTLFGMFFITYSLAPTLALVSLAVVPFIYYSVSVYAKHIEPRLLRARKMETTSLTMVNDAFNMLRIVVAFNRQQFEHRKFRRQGEQAVDARIKVTVGQSIFAMAIAVIAAAGTGAVIGLGAHSVLDKTLTVGELLVVLAYVASIYEPLQTISSTVGHFQEIMIGVRNAKHMFDMQPDVQDRPNATEIRDVEGAVAFNNVSFNYQGRVGTLKGISFEAKPGQVIAIVGPTGAGKTTLAALLTRYYDPQDGGISVDGHDLRDVTQKSLRAQIALVPQEPLLFPATIAENIRYGRLDATEEEMIEAAKAANAHDFIMRLPHRYETRLGERGAKLSGGERQRVCIARAVLKNAPILVLDEPTASVDSRTESVILDALDRVSEGKTTLMIAHRLSTIRHADQILVMNDGELLERGTHDELLEHGGLYRLLWEMQTSSDRRTVAGTEDSEIDLTAEVKSAAPNAEPVIDEVQVSVGGPPLEMTVASTEPSEPRPLAPRVVTANPFETPMRQAGLHAAVTSHRAGAVGPAITPKRKVVVLGLMSKMPVAGVVWQTAHYLVGLRRLGYEPYYVEAHARTPTALMRGPLDDSSARAAEFIEQSLRPFGLHQNWAFHALHEDGACYGLSEGELQDLYRSAELIINLHGGTQPLAEHAATGRLIYVETDPVQLQIELHENNPETLALLDAHVAFFTFGENYGNPDCKLPVDSRFEFVPTRQPVVIDSWTSRREQLCDSFTTIANWQQDWREVQFEGQTYTWSKHLEFEKFAALPTRLNECSLELALSKCPPDASARLSSLGWNVIDAASVSSDLETYRSYIQTSRGEFTVAKDQNIRFRSGWFSDRSATYLAAGRPVVTQDTGFGAALPTGRGLFAFSNEDEAVAALEEIRSHYRRHSIAALQIAREHFDAEKVLRDLLSHSGAPIATPRRRVTTDVESVEQETPEPEATLSVEQPAPDTPAFAAETAPHAGIPRDLDLIVESRRPLVLHNETVRRVEARPLPALGRAAPDVSDPLRTVSIVVVTFNNLVCTRLCLESILDNTGHPNYEIVIVDNASTDATPLYLERLARENPHVTVVQNGTNMGFPHAVNQGVAASSGGFLFVLNNDVIVTPRWMSGLLTHLGDASVGAVGPVTNRAPNEAQVSADYRTYGELLDAAERRRSEHDGQASEIAVLTMFCLAARRAVWDQVGPLDEAFSLGLFEDDDFAERLCAAGLRLLCAEDVLVHHFGEASFGSLVPTGEYKELFEQNRAYFEEKWGREWEEHSPRPTAEHHDLVTSFRQLVEEHVPEDAAVVVVSKGDDALLSLGSRRTAHLTANGDGSYAGHHPADGPDAISQVEQLKRRGARYLAIPQPSFWWLDHYAELNDYLTTPPRQLVAESSAARIFDLGAREEARQES